MSEHKELFERKRRQRSWAIGLVLIFLVGVIYAATFYKGPGFINDRAKASVQPLR